MIGVSFSQRLCRVCSVCQQEIDDEKAKADVTLAVIFGKAEYAICCCCYQQVLDRKDRNYRARWRRWRRKQEQSR